MTFGKAIEANLRSGDTSFELPAERLLTEVLSKVVGKDPELLTHDGSPESLGMFTSAGSRPPRTIKSQHIELKQVD